MFKIFQHEQKMGGGVTYSELLFYDLLGLTDEEEKLLIEKYQLGLISEDELIFKIKE